MISALIFGGSPSLVRSMPLATAPVVIHVPGDAATLQTAVSAVSNGGIIELAAGTYFAPSGGWNFSVGKGFTVQAATGATVILSGSGTTTILYLMNSAFPIVFQDLIFANGYSATDGLAGGVTLNEAKATFINCTFQSNAGYQPGGGGGGTLVTSNSIAFFFNSTWTGNSDQNFGGGLAVALHAKTFIHNSRFTNNRTNLPNHRWSAAGGGIAVVNATLRVSNTRFDNNKAGYVGGGIYSFGLWTDATGSDVIVANCTFENNQAVNDPSVNLPVPTEAGGFHAEDFTTAKIYNSRFVNNSAMIGGGANLYRSWVEIYNSVFQGNRATGTTQGIGFGGAISATSNDTAVDGGVNRRSAYLRVDDSLIQGRFGSTTIAGQSGGGIYVGGDVNRNYGLNGASQMGTVAQNRATAVINNVVFYDLDVQASYAAIGGAILSDLGNLTMQNSLILNSDAIGASNSFGGGMSILDQTLANVSGTTFSHNTTQKYGGAVFAQGSALNLSGSNLIQNSNSSALGSAIYAAADGGRSLPATGTVQTNIFSNNLVLPMISNSGSTIYTNNQFYGTSSEVGTNNTYLPSAPTIGKIAAPLQILTTNAYGDSAPPTLAYLGYDWSGSSATLDGVTVTGNAGLSSAGVGTHTLSVGGTNFTANVSQAATPDATFTTSGNSPVTLNWSVTAGTFLDAAIDHGVTIPSASSGSVQASPPVDTTYWFYAITKEGGVVKSIKTGVPILNVPASVTVLAGLNYPVNKGYFNIKNDGGSTLLWTATSQTPSRITMDTSSGNTPTLGTVGFTLNVGSLAPGDYVGTISVDAGTAGNGVVTVNIKLVDILYKTYLPIIAR